MTLQQPPSNIAFELLREEDGEKVNMGEEHLSDEVVKYSNGKVNHDSIEDEQPLMDMDYEARTHLTFGRPIYDPPGGATNGKCRTSVTSEGDVSITSISDFIPPYKLHRRRRFLLTGIITCLGVAILVAFAVGIHFGSQRLKTVYLTKQSENSTFKTNADSLLMSCTTEEFMCHNVTERGPDQFRSGISCIALSRVCDRVTDCSNGADELNCSYSCPGGMFTCRTGTISRWPFRGFCLTDGEVCNGQAECSDGSDELGCTTDSCQDDEFRCQTGATNDRSRCIPGRRQCDGIKDCADGSDEANCRYACPGDEFVCVTGVRVEATEGGRPGYCLDVTKVCDGADDCMDGSDEMNCTPPCAENEFFCRNGFSRINRNRRCIPEAWLCNRIRDCTDNSDEENCTYGCPEGMNACLTGILAHHSSGYCYRSRGKCDAFRDCEDGSDEAGCEVVCSEDEFKCGSGGEPSMEKCIRKELVCDRRADCSDGSDEEDCPVECPEDQMPCDDDGRPRGQAARLCVPLTRRCDGKADCPNARDEDGCNATCPGDDFRCVSGASRLGGSACLGRAYRCDRVSDCADGSDELTCEYGCPPGEFQCRTGALRDVVTGAPARGYCLPAPLRCDGRAHCADGSDEASCPCAKGQFRCLNGTNVHDARSPCIDGRHVCDHFADCTDKSDEVHCGYRQYDCSTLTRASFHALRCDGVVQCRRGEDEKDCDVRCADDQFRCATLADQFTGSVCIPAAFRCDRVADCADGSDERSCRYACPAGAFMCRAGALYNETARAGARGYCIAEEMACDGRRQCADGSDEHSCSCPPGHFRCLNGRNAFKAGTRCVKQKHVCDGSADCSDGSDELNCHAGSPRCDYFDVTIRCDGKTDCPNNEDEEHCDAECSPGQFRCTTGVGRFTGSVCVAARHRCDRLADCVDGSDEDGPSCDYSCPVGTFPCASGPVKDPATGKAGRGFCLPDAARCDGVAQCLDASDEMSCPCGEGQFKCASGFSAYNRRSRCVPLNHRCDGTPDCSDRSDELNCSNIEHPH